MAVDIACPGSSLFQCFLVRCARLLGILSTLSRVGCRMIHPKQEREEPGHRRVPRSCSSEYHL